VVAKVVDYISFRFFRLLVRELLKKDHQKGQVSKNVTSEVIFLSLWSTTRKGTKLPGRWR